jgi:hypothetical protein
MMSEGVERMLAAAMSLSVEERLGLVAEILRSMEADGAWDAEIGDRIARYDQGEYVGIPAAEVFAALAERAKK